MTVERANAHSGSVRDLVLIDAGVPEPELLLEALVLPCRVVRVPHGADGLGVMRRALGQVVRETGIPPRSVHLIGHGAPGLIRLGRGRIDSAALRRRVVELAGIRRGLAGAHVTLYGCSVGAGESGRAFISTLASAFGSRVVASSTPTGAASRGGDWVFDVGAGGFESGGFESGAFSPPPSVAVSPLFDATRAAAWPGLLIDWSAGTGDWNTGGNWVGGVVPSGVNASAPLSTMAAPRRLRPLRPPSAA